MDLAPSSRPSRDQWLNTYNMQLDKDGNVVFADSNTNSIRAV